MTVSRRFLLYDFRERKRVDVYSVDSFDSGDLLHHNTVGVLKHKDDTFQRTQTLKYVSISHSFTLISKVMELSNALKDGEETKALNRTTRTIKDRGKNMGLNLIRLVYLCLFAIVVLTSVSRVVDGFVRLDEDIPTLEGHHQCPLLSVEAPKDHRQVHKLVLRLLTI